MADFLEGKMSKQFRDAITTFCPRVGCFQIENRVSTGDPDYTLMSSGAGSLIELKVDQSKNPDNVRIKFRPGQRTTLRRESGRQNPAYLLVWVDEWGYLLDGAFEYLFNSSGTCTRDQLERKCEYIFEWPEKSGPGAHVRGLLRYLFG